VSFPNITTNIDDNNANGIVSILHHNFTKSPVFIPVGNEIGSEYTGLFKTTIAKYPSIEFYNSPWVTNTFYEAQLQVKPISEGDFVVFVKVVALPIQLIYHIILLLEFEISSKNLSVHII
jgi:hypothetical protein